MAFPEQAIENVIDLFDIDEAKGCQAVRSRTNLLVEIQAYAFFEDQVGGTFRQLVPEGFGKDLFLA